MKGITFWTFSHFDKGVCVHMCVYVYYVLTHVFGWTYAWRMVEDTGILLYHSLAPFPGNRVSRQTWNKAGSHKIQQSSGPFPTTRELQEGGGGLEICMCTWEDIFRRGAANLNVDRYVCTVGVLPAEPSPQLQNEGMLNKSKVCTSLMYIVIYAL